MTEEIKEPQVPLSPAARGARLGAFVLAATLTLFLFPNAFWGGLALGLIIFVHELGHFTVCKLSGIKVEKFSIGFWTPLVSFERGGTTYQIAAVPLGGYVKPAGEFEAKEGEEDKPHPPDHFLGKPWYIRGLVLLAGPLANFILPVAFFFLLYATLGRPYLIAPPLIEDVVENSAAAEAGIRKGDQILKIDGEWATSVDLLAKLIDSAARKHPGKDTELSVLRADEQKTIKALSRLDRESGKYRLGIQISPGPPPQRREVERVGPGTPAENAGFKAGDEVITVDGKLIKGGTKFPEIFGKAVGRKNEAGQTVVDIEVIRAGKSVVLSPLKKQPVPEMLKAEDIGLIGLEFALDTEFGGGGSRRFQKMGLGQAFTVSVYENFYVAAAMALGIKELIFGRVGFRESVSGPVGIMRMAKQQAEIGLLELLQFMMRISLILGVMNLLPIPLLDGGTLLLCVVEGIRRKPLPFKLQTAIQNVAGALLIALMAFAFYNDFANIFRNWTNR